MSVAVSDAELWTGALYQAVVTVGNQEFEGFGDTPDQATVDAMELAVKTMAGGA